MVSVHTAAPDKLGYSRSLFFFCMNPKPVNNRLFQNILGVSSRHLYWCQSLKYRYRKDLPPLLLAVIRFRHARFFHFGYRYRGMKAEQKKKTPPNETRLFLRKTRASVAAFSVEEFEPLFSLLARVILRRERASEAKTEIFGLKIKSVVVAATMAAREGLDQFLSTTERVKLQIELSSSSSRKKMRLLPLEDEEAAEDDELSSPPPDLLHVLQEEPCRFCGKDSDHANLLICDKCEGHFHTYCLDPPLKEIPEEDWFCGKQMDTLFHA